VNASKSTDEGTKRRMLSDLMMFDELRQRFGALPTPEQFEGADKRSREIMKRIVQGHTLIAHITRELAESENHSYDIQKEIRINFLWREIETLRRIVPLAITEQRRSDAHKAKPGGHPRKDVDVPALLAGVGKGVTYKVLVGKFHCSPALISEIVKKHGGAAAVRKRYRRKQAGR
jgi:hypothetical protein